MMSILFGSKRHREPGTRMYQMPLMISFDEGSYMTREWNMEGCVLTGYRGRKSEGHQFNIIGINPIGEEQNPVLIHALVEHRSLIQGELVLEFVSVSEAAAKRLDTYIDRSVSQRVDERMAKLAMEEE